MQELDKFQEVSHPVEINDRSAHIQYVDAGQKGREGVAKTKNQAVVASYCKYQRHADRTGTPSVKSLRGYGLTL